MSTNIYTAAENQVIAALQKLKASGTELIYIGDLELEGMDTKKIRGTLSSLVKKDRVFIDTKEGGLITLF